MSPRDLHEEYVSIQPAAERLRSFLQDQLEFLIHQNEITLGTPIEGRVKTWLSLEEKVQRRSLRLPSISSLHDLVGLRLILLFARDVDTVCQLIADTFVIISSEDVSSRLNETQFGYQSRHFVVRPPSPWLSMPVLKGAEDLQAEIQVRTVAQHIWAAASHKLQYKHEMAVPVPVRRAIHRVAALLETVDLEFERVLREREAYSMEATQQDANAVLNVETLRLALEELLPAPNKSAIENYDELLQELARVGITTTEALTEFLARNMQAILKEEKEQVERRQKEGTSLGTTPERIERGVFFSHVGLVRIGLGIAFGQTFRGGGAKKGSRKR